MLLGLDGTGYVNGYYIGPGADLSRANLAGADLSGANLEDADLSDADLSHAILVGVVLDGANFTRANLSNALVEDNSLKNATVRAIYGRLITSYDDHYYIELGSIRPPTLDYADFRGAALKRVYFGSPGSAKRADFRGATFYEVTFTEGFNAAGADFSGARLTDCDFEGNMRGASFLNSECAAVRFSYKSNLQDADFSGAHLKRYCRFEDLNLAGVSFVNAKLDSTSFSWENRHAIGMDLTQTNFDGAVITGVIDTETHTPAGWFPPMYLCSPSLRKIIEPLKKKDRKIINKIIKEHPQYMGQRTGLWIHQTDRPLTRYSGDICVSPYEAGEPIYEERGEYGVIFHGTGPLFSADVMSRLNRFGILCPSPESDLSEFNSYNFREGFLDGESAKVIGLNILEGHEKTNIIREFKAAGIPITILPGSHETILVHQEKKANSRERKEAIAILEGRMKNPYHQGCSCGRSAGFMSGGKIAYCAYCANVGIRVGPRGYRY